MILGTAIHDINPIRETFQHFLQGIGRKCIISIQKSQILTGCVVDPFCPGRIDSSVRLVKDEYS